MPTFTLTKLRSDVLTIFKQNKSPIKPYEILERLRKIRPNAQPPTVYRVLEFLKSKNVIHELLSQKKYILCQHDQAHCSFCAKEQKHCLITMLICSKCQKVKELQDNQLANSIKNHAKQNGYCLPDSSTFEFIGLCNDCKKI